MLCFTIYASSRLILIEDLLGLQTDMTVSHENYRREFGQIYLANPIWQAIQQQQSSIPFPTLNSFSYLHRNSIMQQIIRSSKTATAARHDASDYIPGPKIRGEAINIQV